MSVRIALFFIALLLNSPVWAEEKELSCEQLKSAYNHIMDEAHEGNYALILAQAFVEHGLVIGEDSPTDRIEKFSILLKELGEKHGSFALIRVMVGDLLTELWGNDCEFVQKAIRWDPALHESPYEMHASE